MNTLKYSLLKNNSNYAIKERWLEIKIFDKDNKLFIKMTENWNNSDSAEFLLSWEKLPKELKYSSKEVELQKKWTKIKLINTYIISIINEDNDKYLLFIKKYNENY